MLAKTALLLALAAVFVLFQCSSSASNTNSGPTDAPAVAGAPGDTAAPADTAAPTEPPTAEPTKDPNSFEDGKLLVGTDIQPGLYRSANESGGCYWARLSGIGGGTEDILANENAAGPAIVEIAAGDVAFESTRCGSWHLSGEPAGEPATTFGAGTFMVGTDIAPGSYRSSSEEGCYWARLKDFSGTTGSIIANENATGQALVEIAATDVGFTSTRCGDWAPLP